MKNVRSLLVVLVILFMIASMMPTKVFAATTANDQEIVTI